MTAILYPTFALVALVFAVWFVMFVHRMRLMRAQRPRPEDFATREAAMRYFQPAEDAAGNFINLFEMPVLYFALVPLLLVTGEAGPWQVALAWVFVLLRVGHSVVQIWVRRIPLRFLIYLASCIILSAMWIGFAFDIVTRR